MPTFTLHPFTPAGRAVGAPWAATLGFFDGVHLGHRFLLSQLAHQAQERGLRTLAITFSPHPRQVLHSDFRPRLLTTLPEKLELLRAAGVDAAAVLHFTPAVAALTGEEFMHRMLRERLDVRLLTMGYDHRFGSRRADEFADFVHYGASCGIEVVRSEPFSTHDFTVSSSTIRRLLEGGSVERAAQCLGRPYVLAGRVVHGRHVGRALGFPTANLQPLSPERLVPGRGVYAACAELRGTAYGAMVNIGFRPTLDNGSDATIEAHLFDFAADAYGEPLRITFLHRLRDEQRFDSLEALRAQLSADAQAAREALAAAAP